MNRVLGYENNGAVVGTLSSFIGGLGRILLAGIGGSWLKKKVDKDPSDDVASLYDFATAKGKAMAAAQSERQQALAAYRQSKKETLNAVADATPPASPKEEADVAMA